MKDTIYREDAIDAVLNTKDGQGKTRFSNEAIKNINAISSAQPEIIRCKDCKHFEREMLYCDDLGFMCRKDDFCSYAERGEDEEIDN